MSASRVPSGVNHVSREPQGREQLLLHIASFKNSFKTFKNIDHQINAPTH